MSMEVTVRHLGDVQFAAKARGHTVLCDQPLENGGFDEGMTPPEFLLAALGTCAGYYAVQYLRTRNLPTQGLGIRVTVEKAKGPPARLDLFRVEVQYPEVLEGKHRDGILKSVHACLIHNTLLQPPQIQVEVLTPAMSLA